MVVAKSLHPSSGSDGWVTPKFLSDLLGDFDVDPCSNERSHVRARRMFQLEPVGSLEPIEGPLSLEALCALERRCRTEQMNGLEEKWQGSVFCNPSYSNVMPWAVRLVEHDGPWVALLKLDPTTKWWAKLMTAAPTIAPFRKRIAFESDNGRTMTANFPSVLIFSAWRPPAELVPHLWLPRYV